MPPDSLLIGHYASDCRIFHSPLGAVHLLPDIFSAPLRCPRDVQNEQAMGARFPSDDVSVSGLLIPEATCLCFPAPRASRLQ